MIHFANRRIVVTASLEAAIQRLDYFDRLLALDLADEVRLAIHKGRMLDRAEHQCHRPVMDSDGRSDVLEQSWRIGGATSSELAAPAALVADANAPVARASSSEAFDDQPLPDDARVLCGGPDEGGDFVLKHERAETYDFQ